MPRVRLLPALPLFVASALALTPGAALAAGAPTTGMATAATTTATTATDACGAPATPIGAVQGAGTSTPLEGETVTVQGVVTLQVRGSATAVDDGYFVQDAGDGDDATSDGLFVGGPGAAHAVGDVVRVTGTAGERLGQTTLLQPTDELTCATGAALPTPAAIAVPFAGDAERERREGMVVRFDQALLVNDTSRLDDRGQVTLADVLLRAPTDVAEPGAGAQAVLASNALRSIVLDDASSLADPRPVPYVPVGGTLRRGQATTGLMGVLSDVADLFRVQPTTPVSFGDVPRPVAPDHVGGVVRVGSLDAGDLFTTLGTRGAQSAADLQEQTAKLVAALTGLGADAVGLQRVENRPEALDALVAALNAAGQGTWAGVPFPDGLSTPDVVTNAIVYRSDRLSRVGASVAAADPVNTRDPVAQAFEVLPGLDGAGEVFTLVSNHFTDRLGTGSGDDLDVHDGQGAYNGDRVRQALSLIGFIGRLRQVDPDVVAVGDLNAYDREDPLDRLRAAGLTDVTAGGYTSAVDGVQGALDHAFVTPELLAKVTGATAWHVNADEPELLGYAVADNDAYARPDVYRTSDRDPLVIGIGAAPSS